MKEVAIIGIGSTKIGELWEKSLSDLAIEAGIKALEDAGIEGREIELLVGGNMSAAQFVEQGHLGALFIDSAGLIPAPAIRVGAACASGGVALSTAAAFVSSGRHNVVMAAGAEKMTDVMAPKATDILMSAANRQWEAFFGQTFPGLYAMIQRRYMHEFGVTDESFAQVAVKNHQNAFDNPLAHFRKRITVEDVLDSGYIAEPIHLLDCSPLSDGAAALILVPAEKAREYTDTPIYIRASSQASDTLALHDRETLTSLSATKTAVQKAYNQAGISPKDIDLAEVHDAFTIGEIVGIEDLGFFEKGKGPEATMQGLTALDGEIPINPSGGLKAKGHPVGATGIGQAYEISLQLREEAGKRQVKGAEVGMTHNVGGSGGTCVVHILSI